MKLITRVSLIPMLRMRQLEMSVVSITCSCRGDKPVCVVLTCKSVTRLDACTADSIFAGVGFSVKRYFKILGVN